MSFMGRLLIIIGLVFFLLTLTANYFDISIHFDGLKGVTQLGELWYALAPESLQITETIISRYIDPCSTLKILNCSGFLWHPIISSLLYLPAALFLSVFSFLFIYLGLKKRRSYHRTNK